MLYDVRGNGKGDMLNCSLYVMHQDTLTECKTMHSHGIVKHSNRFKHTEDR